MSGQWYLRNGGRDPELREELLARGRELRWHPAHMQARYEDWVGGLAGDWLVSRQRFYGVPIPVWYGISATGEVEFDRVLRPAALPVDPAVDVPPGFAADQRDRPGGFTADRDVLDTWATSSLTPWIAGDRWGDPDLFDRVFPYDLHPQAHEIIRTWLFTEVLRSHQALGRLPWSDTAISGWVLDPDRKKMSKSRGNVTTPAEPLDQFGPDAVRYWAASARLGVDTAYDQGKLRVGRRLAVKLLNVARFVLGLPEPSSDRPTAAVDRAALARLADTVETATAAFDRYDHAGALAAAESYAWWFCDDHVELVKSRAYGATDPAGAASAVAGLRAALEVLLRLLAPVLPYVTEEVWSWWRPGSVHAASWPAAAPLRDAAGKVDPRLTELVSWVLGEVRRAKSGAHVSVRAPVSRLSVAVDEGQAVALRPAAVDLALAAGASHVELDPTATAPEVEVILA